MTSTATVAMTPPERYYGVWLRELRVGTLLQRGDYTRFGLAESYLSEVNRPVLGLLFEQDLRARHAAALRLPSWFSNLLPEGRLREWIASDRQVSAEREMELLAQVGHDLPGAVRVRAINSEDVDNLTETFEVATEAPPVRVDPAWRFSLAGVALKFSMLLSQDRLTLPATGIGGDWIVKLPDRIYRDVPHNEHAMMTLAGVAGIDVPEVRLVHRDDVDGLPEGVWPAEEKWSYAVKRFDRGPHRELVHIEDLAQVRNVYADSKYSGNYETVGSLLFRGHDVESLREFARRLCFCILISNGDAHLKNWSLLYSNPRIPHIAPAYDLVSTRFYMGHDEELGLKFGGTKRYDRIRLSTFDQLERRLGVDADLAEVGRALITAVLNNWDGVSELLAVNPDLRSDINASIRLHARDLLARSS